MARESGAAARLIRLGRRRTWQGSAARRTLPAVARLHQLFARSLREIEAHANELAQTERGPEIIYEAAQLLAALRMWAQSQYRSDQAVR
jgi:hypothetical protein